MTNALKFILKSKNVTQTEFAKDIFISKQTVSKWVLQKKPISKERICDIEEYLGVKQKYFLDEKRYVKILDADEKLLLEDYLLRIKFEQPISSMSKYKYYKNISNLSESALEHREQQRNEYSLAYRRKRANADIQKLIKSLKMDINEVLTSEEELPYSIKLDVIERNIVFYQKLMHLREESKITIEEWDSILKALYMFIFAGTDDSTDKVALEIYKVLRDNRNRKNEYFKLI